MTPEARNLNVYEVRCAGCKVSFPPGTKQCIHCGQRIGGPRLQIGRDPDMPDFRGGEPYPEAEADEADVASPGRFLRIGSAVIWLILAFVTYAVRACQDGGG